MLHVIIYDNKFLPRKIVSSNDRSVISKKILKNEDSYNVVIETPPRFRIPSPSVMEKDARSLFISSNEYLESILRRRGKIIKFEVSDD